MNHGFSPQERTPAELANEAAMKYINLKAIRPVLLQEPTRAAMELTFAFNNLERLFEHVCPEEHPVLRLHLPSVLKDALAGANSPEMIKMVYRRAEDKKEIDELSAAALAATAPLTQLPNQIFHEIPTAFAGNFTELLGFLALDTSPDLLDVKAKRLMMVYARTTPNVRDVYRVQHATLHFGGASFVQPAEGNYHEVRLQAWHEDREVLAVRVHTSMGHAVIAPLRSFDNILKNDDVTMVLSSCQFEMSVTIADSRQKTQG